MFAPQELPVSLLSVSPPVSHAGPRDVDSLIEDALQAPGGTRMLISVKGRADYLVWIVPTVDRSPFGTDDAVRHCQEFLRRDTESTLCLVFHACPPDGKAYLLVATRFTGLPCQSIQLPFIEPKHLEGPAAGWGKRRIPSWPPLLACCSRWEYSRVVYLFLGLLLVVILAICLLIHNSLRFDTSGSRGPQHQLRLTASNVSEWASTHLDGEGEWELRIDDQTMIPAQLLDDDEERHQQWFRHHYPETNEVRLTGDYVNESSLADPNAMKVPGDQRFHTAHCLLALRRYWKAKESGRHVCPVDLDYRHVEHCLDSLDRLVFLDTESPSSANGPDSMAGDWPMSLPWKTKVSDDHLEVFPADPAQIFYTEMSENDAREAVDSLKPQSYQTMHSPCTYAAWKEVPSTYFYCAKDAAIPLQVQRVMVEEWAHGYPIRTESVDASHSPFDSVPGEVAGAIRRAAGEDV
ncbi:hypothetical protein BO70DRAFT_423739 [Aspergillus heteromorphus CBS 117.55]|uniref:AB hydrolase-1 domain-containing protein n=1 Tax=Aspergillus heteromorphus CBS 117.55 TaxID=1448321 RepID=A0A317WEE5_9EURO|nr:uncharacterized protein BO70DRAFT_423739 [Aspergillus heteromorphus CBS 117.55]PWY84753.1 hypothetical protein BO70DRAFT_423739 [Aspergillus heteromorphus CBS 117.55]